MTIIFAIITTILILFVPAQSGVFSLGNFRVLIDNVVYTTGINCVINYELADYAEAYTYYNYQGSVFTGSSSGSGSGNFYVNDDQSTMYNRMAVTVNTSVIVYRYLVDGEVINYRYAQIGDKVIFTSDPSAFMRQILEQCFAEHYVPEDYAYNINFEFPYGIRVGDAYYTWDGNKNTFSFYQDFDNVFISATTKENNDNEVVRVDTTPNGYKISTKIKKTETPEQRSTTWDFLADLIYNATSADQVYFRFVVQLQQTTENDIAVILDDLIGDPNKPLPPSVLLAEQQVEQIKEDAAGAIGAVEELSDTVKAEYTQKINDATAEASWGFSGHIDQDQSATFATYASIISSGIFGTLLTIFAIIKIATAMHRKMGD